ncbi:hypothetical protein [Desulfovibrio inopinatus]|uniref:hypothetical protein n=1 Tax=Desulfovibrio inopinatus TaxID=102109 RepID=UPI000401D886|nr:hypothetical protein [Desulfovibrio inopinatus]
MRILVLATTLLCTAILTIPAFADTAVPDLKGTWDLTYEAAIQNNTEEEQAKRHMDDTGFSSLDVVITIDKQEGFKFSGTKASKKRTEKLSGVIGFDNQSAYMVDEDGMMICRIVSPDKIEQIYLHVTTNRSVASRGMMTRRH